MNNVDKQYLDLMQDVLENGTLKQTRSGEVLSVFGRSMSFDLKEGFPLLTTKKVFYKGIIHELLWFLKGNTNIKYLVENNVHIWDDDAYRYYLSIIEGCPNCEKKSKEDFLQSVLNEDAVITPKVGPYLYGDLGPVYGKQWRDFGGRDQIAEVIKTLQTNPDDRRMLVVAYNPGEIKYMALPPCHVMFQFYTRELSNEERIGIWFNNHNLNDEIFEFEKTNLKEHTKEYNLYNDFFYHKTLSKKELLSIIDTEYDIPKRELSLSFCMRSTDGICGLPFNIASYSVLCHIIANICNMSVGKIIYFGGDVHIYTNHIENFQEQLNRKGSDHLPKFVIKRKLESIDDIGYDDFEIINYNPEPPIKYQLNVG